MPIVTFQDILTDSLTSIGQLGTGQSMSNEQGAQGLRVGNRMIQKWSIQRLMLYLVTTRTFNLVANVQDYTVGPTGTFAGARPTFVESAQATIPGTTMQNPLSILKKSQWDAIADTGARTSANGIPDKIWPEYTFPNLAFHVHPIPQAVVAIKLGTWEVLQQFASLFDQLSLPPGYEEAIATNLAMELCPYYDMPVSSDLQALAADALLKIQGINAQTLQGSLDESQLLQSPNIGTPLPTGPPTGGQ